MVQTGFILLSTSSVAEYCEQVNEPLGLIKGKEFLDQLYNYQFVKTILLSGINNLVSYIILNYPYKAYNALHVWST